jgi:hypothetical protein
MNPAVGGGTARRKAGLQPTPVDYAPGSAAGRADLTAAAGQPASCLQVHAIIVNHGEVRALSAAPARSGSWRADAGRTARPEEVTASRITAGQCISTFQVQ